MIPPDPQRRSWQSALAEAVRDPAELCRAVGLPDATAANPGGWPVLVPQPYLARIRPGDPRDPLLLQVLPRREEGQDSPGFTADPLNESVAGDGAGDCQLLSKYANRSLILASPQCGVHCRFCFRRHGLERDSAPHIQGVSQEDAPQGGRVCFDVALEQLAADATIHEVILSGGDPLTLEDSLLAELAQRLAGIGHLRRLRVHTRMPIVIPDRVTPELIAWLRGTRLTPLVVVHVNHAAEIDAAVAEALGRLIDSGVPVLSQSVLLRGVNDDVGTLTALFERLVDLRVQPYYLHQLDRVAGAAHFEVPEPTGVALMRQLRLRLPGHAVPRYVREVPGEGSKVALG